MYYLFGYSGYKNKTLQNMETEMDVSLSLKVTNGVYVCMPLYSADLSENLSALLISLQSTDVSVCVRRELACQATFHNFRVIFIDNFDDQVIECVITRFI